MAAPALIRPLESAPAGELSCLDTCNTSHGKPPPSPEAWKGAPRERNAVLASYLARDPERGRWAYHKAHADRLAGKLETAGLPFRAARMRSCAEILAYSWDDRLLGADRYCGQRLCPVCQARRATRWAHRVREVLPELGQLRGHWVMLTLTMRSVPIGETRKGIRKLHRAVDRLVKRKEWAARGWIRQTEITANVSAETAHPHCHLLLLVPDDYWTRRRQVIPSGRKGGRPKITPGYMTQKRLRELWARALGADYDPRVDVRKVQWTDEKSRGRAVLEICKYGVKPAELAGLKPEHLGELTEQLAGHRTFSVCGELRRYLRPFKFTELGQQLEREKLIARADPPGRWQGPVPLTTPIGYVAKWDPSSRGFEIFGAGLGVRGRSPWVKLPFPEGPAVQDPSPLAPAEWIGDVWSEPENLAVDDRAEKLRLAELQAKRPNLYARRE